MSKKPNILFIMADQLTALALSAYGNPTVLDPHIRNLAQNGVVFQNAYCNSPLCAPSRASMLTGRLPSDIGAYDNAADFPSSIPTFTHYLRHMGYRTCLSGKMHFVGPDQLHGFEERLTTDIYPGDFGWVCDWNRPVTKRFSWYHNLLSVKQAGTCHRSNQIDFDEAVFFQADQWLYDHARSGDARPFFLMVSFTHPHDPYAMPEAYWNRYASEAIDLPTVPAIAFDELDSHSQRIHHVCGLGQYPVTENDIRNARRAYYAAVSYLDDKIGRLIETLHKTGFGDNTVIVFTSDHGDMLGERGLWYKMSFFESSIRVPLIVSAPNRFSAARIEQDISLINVFATMIDLSATDSCAMLTEGIDDHSLMPLLTGRQGDWPEPLVAAEYLAEGALAPCFMIKKDGFKYIFCEVDAPLLFDLKSDPHERRNLAGEAAYRSVENDLHQEVMSRWNSRQIDRAVRDNQQRRRLIFESREKGMLTPWEFQPRQDAANMYMRNHLLLDEVEAKSRLPRPIAP